MKKLAAIILSLAMILSLAACGGDTPASSGASGEAAAWPKGNIEIIVPFKAGGAMDLSARLTATYLKKYLGVEVSVNNVEGGANWVGYHQILSAKGDGYTLGFANYPGQVGGYLDPSKKDNVKGVTYRDFTNIANIVHDPGIIVVKEDSPYKTLKDLLDAVNRDNGRFQRLRYPCLNGFGRLTDIGGENHRVGQIEIGQQIGRHAHK